MDGTVSPLPKRSRLKLHLSTWIILLLTAAALFLLIVPGEYVDPPPAQSMLTSTVGITFEHGWPWVWQRREVLLDGSTPFATLPTHSIPWAQVRAWRSDGNEDRWSWKASPGKWPKRLAADIVAAIGVLIVLGIYLERRRRRRPLWQFSLAESLAFTVMLCGVLGWWMVNLRTAQAQLAMLKQSGGDQGFSTMGQVDYHGPLWLRRAVGTDHLPALRRVIALQINAQNRSAISELADKLPQVEQLQITTDLISETEWPAVGKFRNLRELHVVGNGYVTDAGLAQLKSFPQLKVLVVVGYSYVTTAGLQHLSNVPELEALTIPNIRGVLDREAIEPIAALRKLKQLDLSNNNFDTSGLDALSGCTALRRLGLDNAHFDKDGILALGRISSLESLQLYRTVIDDASLQHLATLTKLTSLGVSGTAVTRDGIWLLGKKLPYCRVVSSSGRRWPGNTPPWATKAYSPSTISSGWLKKYGIE